MNITVIGGTGLIGAPVVRRLLDQGQAVRLVVRDLESARRTTSESERSPGRLEVVKVSLDDGDSLRAAFAGSDVALMNVWPSSDGRRQRNVITAARRARLPQLVRLSVFNASHSSRGLEQRNHGAIDDAALLSGIGYTSIRPTVMFNELRGPFDEVAQTGQWLGVARHGKIGLVAPGDVSRAVARVLVDTGFWNKHYDLTGPELLAWSDVAKLMSREIGQEVRYVPVAESTYRAHAARRGVDQEAVESVVTRDRATDAGENEILSNGFYTLTGDVPRSLRGYLTEHRWEFFPASAQQVSLSA